MRKRVISGNPLLTCDHAGIAMSRRLRTPLANDVVSCIDAEFEGQS
jgi:hypothetical protein